MYYKGPSLGRRNTASRSAQRGIGRIMKYISAFIVLFLMAWTWNLATAERQIKLEEHRRVETGVEQDIRAFIMRKFPSTRELFCNRLYTEVVRAGTDMIAHFRCNALSGPAAPASTAAPSAKANETDDLEQIFEGFLRLHSEDAFNTWGELGGEIHAAEVNFLKGISISPGGKDKTEDEGDANTKAEAPTSPKSEGTQPEPAKHEHK